MAVVKGSTPGIWQKICEKAFTGNGAVMHGNPNCTMTTGVPTHNVPIGTLNWDVTNSDAYIATDASGTWVKINA